MAEFNNDGKAVDVYLTSSVARGDIAYVEGFLGIAQDDQTSGNYVALAIDERAYVFTVPSGLSVSKGDTVYVDVTDLTGVIPDDSAYYIAADTDRVALFKALENKDGDNKVIGKLIGG